MKYLLIPFIISVIVSCESKQQFRSTNDESSSSNKAIIAMIKPQKSILKDGEVYKAKLYLSDNSILREYNVKTKMLFKLSDSSIATRGFKDTKIVADTGYIEFLVKNNLTKSSKEKNEYVQGIIYINLPTRDTVFSATHEYKVIK